jgi:acyl carrier protein
MLTGPEGVRLRLVQWAGSTGYPATVIVRLSEELEIQVLAGGSGFGVASAGAAADDLITVLLHLAEMRQGTVGQLLGRLPPEFRGTASRAPAAPRRRRGPRLAARSEMEKALVEIWRDLFGDHIGTDENYFDLGAHSLTVARVHDRISSELELDLPIGALYKHPTLRDLAAYLTRAAPRSRPYSNRATNPVERLVCVDAERSVLESEVRGMP